MKRKGTYSVTVSFTVTVGQFLETWCWQKQLWLVTETICYIYVVDKLDQPSTIDQQQSTSSEMLETEVDVNSAIESEDESSDENDDDDMYDPQYEMEDDHDNSESESDESDEESE